jgi:hypothetical protein
MKISFHAAGISILALVLAIPAAQAKKDSLVISIFAKASNDYRREFLPDGNVKPQTYVVGDGGSLGLDRSGSGVEAVAFPNVVRLLAHRLVEQAYYPARNAMAADLLLVVYRGETMPFNDAHLQNANANLGSVMRQLTAAEDQVKMSEQRGESQVTIDGIQTPMRSVRDFAREDADTQMFQALMFEDLKLKANEDNARLLGYVEEINARDNPSRFAGAGNYYDDLMKDLEGGRYYLIVQAYDFHSAVTEGRRRLLWTTRISIPAAGSNFNECVPAMLADATKYFGHSSDRLVRAYREGVVKLGDLEVVGVVPTPEAGDKPSGSEPK